METVSSRAWTCSRCLRAQQRPSRSTYVFMPTTRHISSTLPRHAEGGATEQDDKLQTKEKEMGALSRKLSEMAEDTIDTGSRSDRKLMVDAGISDDLKKKLEERIAQSSFDARDQQTVTIPSHAAKDTQSSASTQSGSSTESVEDAALRILDDAHKKFRASSRQPRIPVKVNQRAKPGAKVSTADRLVNARDKTSIYAFSQHQDLDEKERERLRKEMKEKLTPGARAMPTTLQGLASLANERIEDAIARGQFRNINRGKGVNTERDYNANSPFLDTTEYFMNKIIQKQEIVPPWIEKQQELVKMTNSFRSRLRKDWRRHTARMIASSGGTVSDQVRRAKGYALAEEMVNPRQDNGNNGKTISSDGSLASITTEEEIPAEMVEEIQQELKDDGIHVEVKVVESGSDPTSSASTLTTITPEPVPIESSSPAPVPSDRVLPMPYPFRDPDYFATESAYHNLAIAELNSFTRSYNLMAPKIAQKPYFTLERELKRCFSDVAPTVADEILARHNSPKHTVGLNRDREGILERVLGEDTVWKGYQGRIREEDTQRSYGWKEFWRDLWKKDVKQRRQRET